MQPQIILHMVDLRAAVVQVELIYIAVNPTTEQVLIATPGRLISALNRGEVSLGDVQSAVLDEADVLFMDQSFDLEPIGSACPQETQFIFATATLPNIVVQQILQEFPECALLRGPGLHRVSPIVEETLIDCSGPASQEKNSETAFENKRLALLRALEQTPTERTVIFCNTIAQCRKVENALQRVDRQSRLRVVYPYHGAIDAKTRSEHMTEFSRPLLKVPSVLVCTDRASRGMDFDKAQVSKHSPYHDEVSRLFCTVYFLHC
jgi:ATP-dependent RNA helicase DDX18/HAS1